MNKYIYIIYFYIYTYIKVNIYIYIYIYIYNIQDISANIERIVITANTTVKATQQ